MTSDLFGSTIVTPPGHQRKTPGKSAPTAARPRGTAPHPVLDDPEFGKWWELWKQHCDEHGKPLLGVQEKTTWTDMGRLSLDLAVATIKHSIANGWTRLVVPAIPQEAGSLSWEPRPGKPDLDAQPRPDLSAFRRVSEPYTSLAGICAAEGCACHSEAGWGLPERTCRRCGRPNRDWPVGLAEDPDPEWVKSHTRTFEDWAKGIAELLGADYLRRRYGVIV